MDGPDKTAESKSATDGAPLQGASSSRLCKKLGVAVKDEVVARSVLVKFLGPRKKKVKTPYIPPSEKDLFQYSGRTARQLHQDGVQSGTAAQSASRVRRGGALESGVVGREEHLGPPRRRRTLLSNTQPQTATDYLLAARTTARDKNLARVAEVESQRLEKELQSERAINSDLESQLQYHEAALQEFLQHHYRQVTEALTKGDTARRNLTEQELRIDYFTGLLTEAQTVQEEEEEHLQELTAFQQFLAAVTPSQSLKDLKRRLQEVQDEVKASHGAVGHIEGSDDATSSSSIDFALAASLVAAGNNEIISSAGEGSGGGTLGADLMSLRMIKPGNAPSRSPSRTGCTLSQSMSSEDIQDFMTTSQEDSDTCDAGAFDEFLDDDGHLVDLASVYENQCHALLALLTRLKDHTEAINKEVVTRQKRLDTRLQDIQQLQEKARGGGHEEQLQDLRTLIGEWPRLSGDAEAQNQLDQLVAQIAEVVSDVFGSSEYSPLVPQPPQAETNQKKQVPKVTTELDQQKASTFLHRRQLVTQEMNLQ
ncbi:uncharacterized protein LOC121871859 isoform X2 [Homarus americanus]|uniref:uncharacterized protein LOC121871859 isoform X2 n=1 Tax=Homarus americanus TaxID=6706 RepID=UPI001C490AD4|nr:uncharacterized protein LOC121871859 isoform X2 [Homarus americanus]